MKKIFSILKRFYNFCIFVEEERIKCMTFMGHGKV